MPRDHLGQNIPRYRNEAEASARLPSIARDVARGWRTILLNATLLVPLTEERREVLGDALEAYAWGDILEIGLALREAKAEPDENFEAVDSIAPYLSESEKAAMAKVLFDLLHEDGVVSVPSLEFIRSILQRMRPRSAETLRYALPAQHGS